MWHHRQWLSSTPHLLLLLLLLRYHLWWLCIVAGENGSEILVSFQVHCLWHLHGHSAIHKLAWYDLVLILLLLLLIAIDWNDSVIDGEPRYGGRLGD